MIVQTHGPRPVGFLFHCIQFAQPPVRVEHRRRQRLRQPYGVVRAQPLLCRARPAKHRQPAPQRNDPDPVLRKIMQEAYSHEVISAGWWPGGGEMKDAAFYCYAAPEPPGFAKQKVRPEAAYYDPQLGEFLLMHEQVRTAASPTETLLDFLQSTYEAAAVAAKWDRDALECAPGQPGVVRQI